MAGGFQMTIESKQLAPLEKKLGGLITETAVPELEAGLDTLEKRMLRGGRARSYGKRNNVVGSDRAHLSRRVHTTLRNNSDPRQTSPSFGSGAGRRKNPDFNPRSSGRKWLDYQVLAVFKKISPSVVRSVIKKINARWAA